jgi:hypothetical protein
VEVDQIDCGLDPVERGLSIAPRATTVIRTRMIPRPRRILQVAASEHAALVYLGVAQLRLCSTIARWYTKDYPYRLGHLEEMTA